MTVSSLSTNSKICVGLAGLGFGEKVHLPALYNSEILTPVGIWHPREERLNKVLQDNNSPVPDCELSICLAIAYSKVTQG